VAPVFVADPGTPCGPKGPRVPCGPIGPVGPGIIACGSNVLFPNGSCKISVDTVLIKKEYPVAPFEICKSCKFKPGVALIFFVKENVP
jgi:hypothetical protein